MKKKIFKFLKYFLVVLIIATTIYFINSNRKRLCVLDSDEEISWIPFEWEEAILGNDTLIHASIRINCKLEGIKEKVQLQFDLGSSNTLIYEAPYNYLQKKYSDLPFSINEEEEFTFASKTAFKMNNVDLSASGVEIKPEYFALLKDYGEEISDSIDTDLIHLGTIGLDI